MKKTTKLAVPAAIAAAFDPRPPRLDAPKGAMPHPAHEHDSNRLRLLRIRPRR
jgi:hypothetical protein